MALMGACLLLGCIGLDAAEAQEKRLHDGTVSGGRVRVEIEFAPVDRLNPGVLNGALNTADTDGNGIPDHVQNADLHLEAQIRYVRGRPNLGARVAQEFVPFLRVTAFITNTTTAVTSAVRLLPHLGVTEGWHYASNVQFQGDLLNDVYNITIRLDPPTGLAEHSDFAGQGDAGTLYANRIEIALRGITNIDLANPDGISGPTTVTVTENLPSGT